MHILIDLQSCQNGSRNRGIGRYALSITRAIIARGRHQHSFSVLLSDRFSETVSDIRKRLADILPVENIHVLNQLSRTSAADVSNAWRNEAAQRLRQLAIRQLDPDVVFDPSPLEGLWDDTRTSASQGRHINVATLHDLIPLSNREQLLPADNDFHAYLRLLEEVRRADAILAVSSYTKSEAVRLLNIDATKIFVAELGSDESIFRPSRPTDSASAALLSRLGISRKFILNTSPLEQRKNVEGLIAGYGQLPIELRDQYELVIIGRFDDYARNYISGLAAAEGVPLEQVILPGYVSDSELALLYSRCEAFVFPSLAEGFGLPALEAMACGAPVIGSNLTSIPEVIGRDDLLFDPRDPMDLRLRLQQVLTDDVFRSNVRAYGQRRAATFTWEATADKALRAMEASYAKKIHTGEVYANSCSSTLRKVAFFWPEPRKNSRVEGVARRLLQVFSETTAFVVVHDSTIDKDDWMAANVEFRPSSWLECGEAESYRFVHLVPSDSDQQALEWMVDRHGTTIVIDDIQIREAEIRPPVWAMDALFGQGAAKLAEGLQSKEGGVGLMSGELLREISERVILSDHHARNSDLGEQNHNVFRAPPIPIAKSVSIRETFRRSLNVSGEKLVVAFVENEKSAGDIVNYVRGRGEKAKLVVQHVLSSPGMKISQLIADVWQRYPPELNYDELLNAADEVIIKEELQEGLQSLLRCDCNGVGIPLTCLSNAQHTTQTGGEPWEPRALSNSILGCPTPSRADWLPGFMEPVRGVLPSADDVAAAANAIATNDSLRRAPRIYVDISPFSSGVIRKPGPRIGNFLRGLASLNIGEQRIRFCYQKENTIFSGEKFSSHLFALPGDWGMDNITALRAGDLVVLLDAVAEINTDQHSLYKAVTDRNATILVLAVEEALRKCAGNSFQLGHLVAEFLLQSRSSITNSAKSDFSLSANTANAQSRSRFSRVTEQVVASAVPFVGIDLNSVSEGGADDLYREFSVALGNFWRLGDQSDLGKQEAYNRFVVFGHMLGTYSLAIINRSVAGALEQTYPGNVRIQAVETVPVNDFSSLLRPDRELLEKLAKRTRPIGRKEVAICQHYPIIEPPEAELSLSLLAWEETRLPKHIVDTLNANYQGVIAPARSVEKALADSGVRIPIGTIGQPTQSLTYYSDEPLVPRRAGQGTMTFLHVSSCFPRKGVDVLLRAWQRAFRMHDPVRLIIKTFPNPHNTIESDVSALRTSDEGSAIIEIINQDLNESEMIDLFKQADAMVLPTRGEGFNLPALEAMLAGVPLIVTGYGGHIDFCSDQNSRLLDFDFARAESHVADRHSLWVNPNEDDLVHALRERVDEACYQLIQERVVRARETALQIADWSAWTDRLDEWLDTVQQPPERPRIAWLSTWDVQCGIAQYSSFLIEAMSPETREETLVLCDSRTRRKSDASVVPCWSVQQTGLKETVLTQVVSADAQVIVVQHQDGLISWRELAGFANDQRVRSRTSIFVLHNPRGLLVPSSEERDYVVNALRSVDRLLVHSVADVNLLKQFGLVDNVTLFPHGASKGTIRARPVREITDGSPIIGCHGFFLYHKGIEKLVAALAQLRQQWPGIKLRLLNARFPDPVSDAAIQSCRDLVAKLGLDSSIEWYLDFLPVSGIQAKLADCDLIVLPYDQSQDSASGAARIALSSYSPVLATNVNIFAEFKDVVDMVPNNDPDVLASRIDELLRLPNERLRIQTQMDEWLSSHEWQPTAERLEDIIYAQLLKKKSMAVPRTDLRVRFKPPENSSISQGEAD